jgi:hypothetical protein
MLLMLSMSCLFGSSPSEIYGKLDSDDWVHHDENNWPKCGICHQNARPAIGMFGDMDWKDNEAQERRWISWQTALYELT